MSPKFSVVVPVHDPPVGILREACESVMRQTFPDWELCLVDDGSTDPDVRAQLDELALHPAVHLVSLEQAGGISVATNAGIGCATGEYVALLDHDDLLHPRALAAVAAHIDAAAGAVDLVYTDEDLVDDGGRRHSPFFKPTWSPERFRTQMYLRHLLVLRRAIVESVGCFRKEMDGAQDWDLAWRVAERGGEVLHVPHVLYHWRQMRGSTAANPDAKRWAFDAGTRVLQQHCDRSGVQSRVEHDDELNGVYHLRPSLVIEPLVSVVVPTRGARRLSGRSCRAVIEDCVTALVEKTTYENWELVLVSDPETPEDVITKVGAIIGDRFRLVRGKGTFNYSERNNVGTLAAQGEQVLFLNDDVVPASPDWIESLLVHAMTPGVGAVGARLLYPDGRIQHVGTSLAQTGPAHLYHGYPGHHLGYGASMRVASNLEAVTGACMMTSRSTYLAVGGMSAALPLNFNDVDYCQKLIRKGLRVVYCPDAVLTHFESATRGPGHAEWELQLFWSRWRREPLDRYRNPNLVDGGLPPLDRTVYSRWWESSNFDQCPCCG